MKVKTSPKTEPVTVEVSEIMKLMFNGYLETIDASVLTPEQLRQEEEEFFQNIQEFLSGSDDEDDEDAQEYEDDESEEDEEDEEDEEEYDDQFDARFDSHELTQDEIDKILQDEEVKFNKKLAHFEIAMQVLEKQLKKVH